MASHPHTLARLVIGTVAVLASAACSTGSPSGAPTTSAAGGTTTAQTTSTMAPIPVTAAFYPLEFALTKVGGKRVAVTSLTKPGAEPHDLELTAQDVAGLGKAKLVVVLKGFQPAVDKAVEQQAAATAFDVASFAALDLKAPEGHEEGEEEHHDDGPDPHFWLDPQRYGAVATALGERLAQLDPSGASEYRANAAAFTSALSALDAEMGSGLKTCANRTIVTSHAAFGYLARRYSLTQVAIAGLSPDQEPSAKQLADVTATVRAQKATTIYAETLVDNKFAQTVATSTGAKVAVLDPIEGITSASAGSDYLMVMRANLATLRAGQGCS